MSLDSFTLHNSINPANIQTNPAQTTFVKLNAVDKKQMIMLPREVNMDINQKNLNISILIFTV